VRVLHGTEICTLLWLPPLLLLRPQLLRREGWRGRLPPVELLLLLLLLLLLS
jgi:hypothetical protein